MTKEELINSASQIGSEYGPLGQWKASRLETFPEAGMLLQEHGHWYVALAGSRREGTRGTTGGLYARWVQVPDEISLGW